jgi:probable phosphoglycerate mutase
VALLIRHAATDATGHRLTGRLPGVQLNGVGHAQAARLPFRLRHRPLDAIYTSPMLRAVDTARPLARARGLALQSREDLNEVDFGEWTGLTFEELARLQEWRDFNVHRGTARVPGGECVRDLEARIVGAVHDLLGRHEGRTIALVTHAEVIRVLALHYAGIDLDLFDRIVIDPASVTTLLFVRGATPALVRLNQCG